MIESMAVVVPARDEERSIARCVASIDVARRRLAAWRPGIEVRIVLALDGCRDDTASVAATHLREDDRLLQWGDVRGPGAARRTAVAAGIASCCHAPENIWIATTDADSTVPPHWLAAQVDLAELVEADAVAGTIELTASPTVGRGAQSHAEPATAYRALLRSRLRPDGTHTHAYGANLGVRASAYADVGGFTADIGEDMRLWEALRDRGHVRVAPADLVVSTSARRVGRARGGLADLLKHLDSAPDQLRSVG